MVVKRPFFKTFVYVCLIFLLIVVYYNQHFFVSFIASQFQPQVETAITVILALGIVWSFYKIVGIWLERFVPVKFLHSLKKTFSYTLWGVTILALLIYFFSGERATDVGVIFGLFAAGLSFALQRPILCFVGWLLLMGRKIYREGDRIQIGGLKGDVADVGIMTTTILEVGSWAGFDQSTGRLLTFPNAWILEKEVRNYTSGLGYIWDEITVRIPYDADWKKAKKLLERIALKNLSDEVEIVRKRMSRLIRRIKVHTDYDSVEINPKTFVDLKDSWVELRLRYVCPTGMRRTVRSEISEKILEEFKKNRIPITFPSMRWIKKPIIPK